MTWSRAVLILRQLHLEDRMKSPDKHEARRAYMEAERAAETEGDE